MKNLTMNRRSATFLLFGCLFLWQVTPLFFPRIPYIAKLRGATLDAVKSAYALPAFPFLKLSSLVPDADPVVIIHSAKDLKGASLYSDARSYLAVFTGKVSCVQAGCPDTHVRLQMETTYNDDLNRKATVAADGSYRIEVPFKETPHEHMDYTLSAYNDQSQSSEVHGRRILMEETVLPVDNVLHLD